MSRRCRRHKERRRCSVQILDNFWDKCFGYKVAKKVCKQAPLLYAPTVPPLLPLFCFDIPPYSPCLRVTLLQTLSTSGKPYHSKILKSHLLIKKQTKKAV